jgi:signal transduction histidine kinase
MRRPTLIAAGTAILVAVGMLLGVQRDNLHNGLLALSLAAVGDFVLRRRPGQREAQLFLAAGAAQAVMFLGRQVGGRSDPPVPTWVAEWVGWVGIWPLPLVLVLVGATIMCFPDGRFPGPGWRRAFQVMLAAASVLALTSALWPVDYDRADLVVDHPLGLPGADAAQSFFDVAQPMAFTAIQVVWLACVIARFAKASADEARQLRWLVAAVGLSVVALMAGLLVDGSPHAGLLTVPLIPVAAGIAIVESSYETLVREVQSSAKRIVSAQDEARRRIERDLHDGAQHRLVVLGMELGRLVDRAATTGNPELVSAASAARQELLEATAELRELARGIHPSVLTQDGLAPALAALADQSPIPVHLHVEAAEPCPPEVEATAYFVVSEALTNAARHSGAGQVIVRVSRTRSSLRLDVSDDGRGGATAQGGLQGLTDRVASLGGRLTLESPPGAGTRLVVELPCQ